MSKRFGSWNWIFHIFRYQNYVFEWIKWAQRNNTMAYRFGSKPDAFTAPKPGEFLLPSLGFCDVVEGYHDNLDVHRFVRFISSSEKIYDVFLTCFCVLFFIGQFVIMLVINKSDFRCAVVRFCHHSYKYRPNWTEGLSLIHSWS